MLPEPPKDYTTKVAVVRTMSEITAMLAKAKARSISTMFDEHGEAAGLTFTLDVGDERVEFALPARWQAVHRLLIECAKTRRVDYTPEQARRVAWRQIRDWVAAQIALCQVGMVKLEEIMMPFAIFGWDREKQEPITAYQLFEKRQLALPAPREGRP